MGYGELGRGWPGVHGGAAVLCEASGSQCAFGFRFGALSRALRCLRGYVLWRMIVTNRRDFLFKSATAAAGIAARSILAGLSIASQSEAAADSMDLVNPELRPALMQVSPFLSRLKYNDASLSELRRLMETTSIAPLDNPPVTEHLIPNARLSQRTGLRDRSFDRLVQARSPSHSRRGLRPVQG